VQDLPKAGANHIEEKVLPTPEIILVRNTTSKKVPLSRYPCTAELSNVNLPNEFGRAKLAKDFKCNVWLSGT